MRRTVDLEAMFWYLDESGQEKVNAAVQGASKHLYGGKDNEGVH